MHTVTDGSAPVQPAELRHELRTPLNQIVGYSEMLLEDVGAENEELRAEIGRIHDAAYGLVGIIAQLIPAGADSSWTGLMERVRDGLRGPAEKLSGAAAALAGRPDAVLHPFAEHIESAARSLAGFAVGSALIRDGDAPGGETQERPSAAGARLLIADDNKRNREILVHQLERQGYRATSVSNGRDALKLLREHPFDLALLDVFMPLMDGFSALEAIKKDPELREIPVIMISASDEYSSVIRCIESGAEDYLPKPFDPVLLRARLKASLEKKALRDEQKRKTEELERAYQNLQRMQDQLVTQEKLASLGSLAAGIAHEIKNPLNFITNFAKLSGDLLPELRDRIAQGDREGSEEILDDLDGNLARIQHHGGRADRIVRGMLGHARKSTGEREDADLNGLAVEAVNLAYHGVRSQDAGFNARLEFGLDPAMGKLNVFPQDLSRVFLNIATNALHALAEKIRAGIAGYEPVLQLTTSAGPDAVEIRIRDNGLGIPEDIRRKIFDPFFTTKPAGAGTGLGLSISHDIVYKEHHGELQVESEPGRFTELTVRLPRNGAK